MSAPGSTVSTVSASRVAALVGRLDDAPLYVALADALVLLVGDGRIPLDTRLPSERELTEALAVSRTTVTRAYALLREQGYAVARQGAGTFTRVPGGRARARDRALLPAGAGEDVLDLSCAAGSAPPGLAAAYAEALGDLPEQLGSHGYFPTGLPALQAAIAAHYERRGLPTSPEQVLVTPGALTAAADVAQALLAPGDRAVVESPVYANATRAIRHAGARLVPSPVDPDGWDLDAVASTLAQARAPLAYLVADFQNPTGHLMDEEQREAYAAHLRRAGTRAVVDETMQQLALDDGLAAAMPRPFACAAPDTITLGSASKSYWGGLRIGWIRTPPELVDRLVGARVALDLGASVLEQLVLARVLDDAELLAAQRERLRRQRDALLAAVATHLPDWRVRRPGGGLVLWCELPAALATRVADEAERRGVLAAPGPMFAVEGGLDRFLRIPWAQPVPVLEESVRRLAEVWGRVWEDARRRPASTRPGRSRVMVA